jgi:hypothetical protein
MTPPHRALTLALLLVASPALGAWEELRRNDSVRLSIDPKSIKARGDRVAFRYLIDYRETQGDYKTSIYRSLASRAAIRCKARTIATYETEGYAGNGAEGPMIGVMKDDNAPFKKVEAGTSDEDLWKRLCRKPAAGKK